MKGCLSASWIQIKERQNARMCTDRRKRGAVDDTIPLLRQLATCYSAAKLLKDHITSLLSDVALHSTVSSDLQGFPSLFFLNE